MAAPAPFGNGCMATWVKAESTAATIRPPSMNNSRQMALSSTNTASLAAIRFSRVFLTSM